MKMIRTCLAAAALTVASVSAASALTVTFNFTGPGAEQPTFNFSSGGINVTADAFTTDEARTTITNGVALVSRSQQSGSDPNTGGLGVRNAPGDLHEIDGAVGLNDLLTLFFDRKVKLVSALFTRVTPGVDDFDFWTSAGYQFTAAAPLTPTEYLFGGVVDDTFRFGAVGSDDRYKLRSVTVSTVPLPPAAVLLVTGLLGIGALSRKKRKEKLAA
jgi:hypothetical protein